MARAKKSPTVDIVEILRQVAREKDMNEDELISALEDAMASAARKHHKIKEPVRAEYVSDAGAFRAYKVLTVVEEVEDPISEWTLDQAREERSDAEIGQEIHLPISTEGLGRIAAQSAKQVLFQKTRELERNKIYDEYIGRVGELINGTVRRFERGDIIVDLGRTEAVVPRREQSRHERYSQGERIRAVIVHVHAEPRGSQVILSRTDPRLLIKLFEMEVPEIYDGTVLIKNAVRAPGERAKVAVVSRERDVDPVGACVGMKGSRVQAIIRELRGEKIDIIEYSDDLVTFAQSALAPAKITRVSVHSQGERPLLDVIVEDEQLSLAIGKRGQNVRLASSLIGAKVDIKSETDVKDEVADALAKMLQISFDEETEDLLDLTSVEGVSEEVADALIKAGYGEIGILRGATAEELSAVEGVDSELAEALLAWAEENSESSLDMGPLVEETEEATPIGGDAFMDALSKAFQESGFENENPEDSEG